MFFFEPELQSTGSEKKHVEVEPSLTKKTGVELESKSPVIHGDNSKQAPQEVYKNLRNILSSSLLSNRSSIRQKKTIPSSSLLSNHSSIRQELETAEELGGCTIDFQI